MTSSSFANHRSGLNTRRVWLARWSVCIAAMVVLSLGRPGFGMPPALVSEREIDPVEQEDSKSEEELAIHRRRVPEQSWSVPSHVVFQMIAGEMSCRTADLSDRVSPHDFDLRNGLGTSLRC